MHAAMGLVERAILRVASQYVSGFRAEDFTTEHNMRYSPRDCIQSNRGMRAAEMAFYIYNNHYTLIQYVPAAFAAYIYGVVVNKKISLYRLTPPKSDVDYNLR